MTKLTYTGDEVQKLLDKIEAGDFDNAKTLEGHSASYFAKSEAFTILSEAFITEQENIDTLQGYFTDGSANNALRLGDQLPSYYATAEGLSNLSDKFNSFKALFDSLFEKDADNNAIKAKLSLYSLGGVTAGGVGSDSSSGSGSSYSRLDSWGDYSADKAGYVLSALLGNDLHSRVQTIEGAGYITQSALANYALRSELPTKVSALTNDSGYITGITSSMVVTALGYTPYDSANFTKSNIKSTLGISDWALATSLEWSAINGRPTKLSDFTDDVVAGKYFPLSGGTLASADIPLYINRVSSTAIYSSIGYKLNNQLLGYLGFDHEEDLIVSPKRTSNSTYYKILHSGNYSDLLAGGTINGSLTATSFIGNLTGNADSATFTPILKETASSTSWLTTRENELNINNSIATTRFWFGYRTPEGSPYPTTQWHFGNGSGNGEYGNVYAATFIGNLSGNADSATKLATPRTIWGQSFDGTKDITGAITSSSIIKASSFFSTSISIECDANGVVDPITYGGEINRFGSNLYLQNRNGDLYLNHADGTTYIRGALNGVSATFTGALTASSFIGNLTGNADSATFTPILKETASSTSWLTTRENELNINNSIASTRFWFGHRTPEGSPYPTTQWHFGNGSGNGEYGNVYAATFIGNLSGNADSATKLATARTIWGQSFDGTKDITEGITLRGYKETGSVTKISDLGGRGLFITASPNNTRNYWGMAMWTESDGTGFIQQQNWDNSLTYNISLQPFGGNVGVGSSIASEKLHVHGNILSTANVKGSSVTIGGITLTYDATNNAVCVNGNLYTTGGITAGQASDARLKQNVATMTEQDAISTIMALRPVTFEWNALARSHDGRLYGNSQGFIAQEFERLIENSGRAIYGHYRAIDTTKAIPYLTTVAQNHERRISDLERENKALREEVEHLRKVA